MSSSDFRQRAVALKVRLPLQRYLERYHGATFKRNGSEMRCRCPFPDHEDRDPSFDINPDKDLGICRGCGQGGDLIALHAALSGCSRGEALADLERREGVAPAGASSSVEDRTPGTSNADANPNPLGSAGVPSSSRARSGWQGSSRPPAQLLHPKLGEPAATWSVRDAHGRLFAVHCRFETKTSKTLRWWRDGRWNLGGLSSDQAPLYGSEHVAQLDVQVPVFLVEGEKAADALRTLGAPALATVTGAAGLPGLEALAVLGGRRLTLWPDHDPVGRQHMGRLAKAAEGLASELRVFDPYRRRSGPPGADAVDWIASLDRRFHHRDAKLAEMRRAIACEAICPGSEDPATDAANASRFLQAAGRDFLYAEGLGGWLVWDSARFTRDLTHRALDTARRVIPARIYQDSNQAAQTGDMDRADRLARFARRSHNTRPLEAALQLARADPAIAVTPEDLDAEPEALHLPNGRLNLITGQFQPRAAAERPRITRVAGAAFNPKARCPRWLRFLDEVLVNEQGETDRELQGFVHRAVGYGLTGLIREHALFVLYGRGANGKSVFLETLATVLGDYAHTLDLGALLADPRGRPRTGPNEAVAQLRGARFAIATESDAGARFSESMVKRLTGGDRLVAEFKYGHQFSFAPSHKLWLALNERPRVRDASDGFWRRLRLVPFLARFHEQVAEVDLMDRLREERSGILTWALHGLESWHEKGLGHCHAVDQATADYRQEEDPLSGFIQACCLLEPTAQSPCADLYRAYERWCEDSGQSAVSALAFSKRLSQVDGVGTSRTQRILGKVCRVRPGILLQD